MAIFGFMAVDVFHVLASVLSFVGFGFSVGRGSLGGHKGWPVALRTYNTYLVCLPRLAG